MHPPLDPLTLLRPRRKIVGMSAILLPFDDRGRIDWDGFRAHVARTFAAGLVPAVNMDTGYVNLLTPDEKRQVLAETRALAGGKAFVAGAFVGDAAGAAFDLDAYRRAIDEIGEAGGTPGHLPVLRPDGARRRAGAGRLPGDRQTLPAVHRVRAGDDVRPVRPDLRPGHLRRPAGDPEVRRGQALVARPDAGVAAAAAARRAPAGLPGPHRQRPRHRHGDVRQRLPARPEHVRPGPVREARRAVGRPATPASTS